MKRSRPPVQVTPANPKELRLGRLARLMGRGVTRRCPNCGGGGLFRRWLLMRASCPRCHLKLDRGEADYFIGSFTINLVTAELVVFFLGLGGILLTWPDVPWEALKWTLMAAILPVPALFYPFAKTLWLAVDLNFRPPTPGDFEGHGENLPGDVQLPDGVLPLFPKGLSGS